MEILNIETNPDPQKSLSNIKSHVANNTKQSYYMYVIALTYTIST